MRSLTCTGAALAVLLLSGASTVPGPCDLKTLEKGFYCEKCDKVVDPAAVKEEKCPACEQKVKAAEICVKKTKDGVDKARILWKCEGCGKEVAQECSSADCRTAGKKAVKMCSKSGKEPHTTP